MVPQTDLAHTWGAAPESESTVMASSESGTAPRCPELHVCKLLIMIKLGGGSGIAGEAAGTPSPSGRGRGKQSIQFSLFLTTLRAMPGKPERSDGKQSRGQHFRATISIIN